MSPETRRRTSQESGAVSLHVWAPNGPYKGVVWFRGRRRGELSGERKDCESARRWCLRRMLREPMIGRAVVVRLDYDDNIPVWRGSQR